MLSPSVISDSLRTHGLQPTRLLRPWDFPGKNTGVGGQVLLQGAQETASVCLTVKTICPSSPFASAPGKQISAVNLGFVSLQVLKWLFALGPQSSDKSKKSPWLAIFFSFFLRMRATTSKFFMCQSWNQKRFFWCFYILNSISLVVQGLFNH